MSPPVIKMKEIMSRSSTRMKQEILSKWFILHCLVDRDSAVLHHNGDSLEFNLDFLLQIGRQFLKYGVVLQLCIIITFTFH